MVKGKENITHYIYSAEESVFFHIKERKTLHIIYSQKKIITKLLFQNADQFDEELIQHIQTHWLIPPSEQTLNLLRDVTDQSQVNMFYVPQRILQKNL